MQWTVCENHADSVPSDISCLPYYVPGSVWGLFGPPWAVEEVGWMGNGLPEGEGLGADRQGSIQAGV